MKKRKEKKPPFVKVFYKDGTEAFLITTLPLDELRLMHDKISFFKEGIDRIEEVTEEDIKEITEALQPPEDNNP